MGVLRRPLRRAGHHPEQDEVEEHDRDDRDDRPRGAFARCSGALIRSRRTGAKPVGDAGRRRSPSIAPCHVSMPGYSSSTEAARRRRFHSNPPTTTRITRATRMRSGVVFEPLLPGWPVLGAAALGAADAPGAARRPGRGGRRRRRRRCDRGVGEQRVVQVRIGEERRPVGGHVLPAGEPVVAVDVEVRVVVEDVVRGLVVDQVLHLRQRRRGAPGRPPSSCSS